MNTATFFSLFCGDLDLLAEGRKQCLAGGQHVL